MVPQHPLDVGSLPGADRIEVSDHLPPTDDGEMLAAMLDGVEQIGEVACCIRGTDLRHAIRLSDLGRMRRADSGPQLGTSNDSDKEHLAVVKSIGKLYLDIPHSII